MTAKNIVATRRKRAEEKKDHAATQRMGLEYQSDSAIQHGILHKARIIYYPTPPHPEVGGDSEGVVNIGSTRVFINAMNLIESYSKPKAEIRVIINCLGGDEYQGMAVYDTIRQSKHPVMIEGRGQIMSMGVFILQAGARRLLSENARLMVHVGTWGDAGEMHSTDHARNAREGVRLKNIYRDVLWKRIKEKHPDYSLEQIKNLIKHDKYLSATEAVELGLADEIIQPAQK